MTDNQLDDIFKNRLNDFNSDVPADMWQRIIKKDKDRKLFFILLWSIIGVGLLLGASFGGYFFFNSNEITKTNQAIIQADSMSAKQKDQSNIIDRGVAESELINTQGQSTVSGTNANEKKAKNYGVTNLHTGKQENYATASKEDKPLEMVMSSQQPIANDAKEPAKDPAINAFSSQEPERIQQTLPKKDSIALPPDEQQPADKNNNDHKDKFSIELYASPVLPVNVVHSDNKAYEKTLTDAGNMQLSYSFGARIELKINKNFSAKTGVEYQRINQQMYLSDSVLTGEIPTNNRYKSIHIPLLFSYNTSLSSSIQASITTGILLNISSSYSGAIPTAYGSSISIKGTNVYNQNNGVSIYLGAGVSKSIGTKTSIFVLPYFQYRLKNMTGNMQPFTQKIHNAGIELGLHYKLLKKENKD